MKICKYCYKSINFGDACFGCILLRANPLLPTDPKPPVKPKTTKSKTAPKTSNVTSKTSKRRCQRCFKEVRAKGKRLCYECRKKRGYLD